MFVGLRRNDDAARRCRHPRQPRVLRGSDCRVLAIEDLGCPARGTTASGPGARACCRRPRHPADPAGHTLEGADRSGDDHRQRCVPHHRVVRVLAVGGALGTTFLGNTYQTANLVSNVLFELLAAGMLSSVLVPTFVALVDGDATTMRAAGRRAARACVVVLGAIALGMLASQWVMRLLTVAVTDPAVRRPRSGWASFSGSSCPSSCCTRRRSDDCPAPRTRRFAAPRSPRSPTTSW